MSQVTLYLDDETDALMRAQAQAAGVSDSRWVADLIRDAAEQRWPAQVIGLAGSFADFPLREDAPPPAADVSRAGF
ncbi:ribbon-helix-helix domain-containing protein [Ramlibacter sp. H39-3-26]|uniref:ribbon-helix-helix domain-containing protein n=1 Tax=Curvibacter soli TaxID=3031331 RepID=UPI0023D9EDF2|nr:CopG family transcriptional regulator [Ramlibacter sp. H39-3-26]MDF1485614.1 ribbon-helix-helix domain-containing protein [Ramlibacter sp. H39-3-26]